jgi:hypothetical protein
VSPGEIEQLQADADYYHDRVALLRAKLYRWGLPSNARLRALERALERAQQRLSNARLRDEPPGAAATARSNRAAGVGCIAKESGTR